MPRAAQEQRTLSTKSNLPKGVPGAVFGKILEVKYLIFQKSITSRGLRGDSDDPASPSQTDVLPFYRGGPQRLARVALAIALALLATWMLWAFLPALAWAAVLAITKGRHGPRAIGDHGLSKWYRLQG
jgi:hypothetical protein